MLPGPGALQCRFRLGDNFVGVGVFLGIFAGFVPELLAVLKLFLGCSGVYFFGLLRGFCKDGDALGQHFDEAAGYVVSLIA
jgi:hypothetical protein